MGRQIAAAGNAAGIKTRAHEIASLELEYGTLVPMRYMNGDGHFKSRVDCRLVRLAYAGGEQTLRRAVLKAIEDSDSTVMVLASGSLSHRFADSATADENIFKMTREFDRQVDLRVVDLWKQGDFKSFTAMLPEYALVLLRRGA